MANKEKFIINQSSNLCGKVRMSGAKNSALPILAATILADEECRIFEVPQLDDIDDMIALLTNLGMLVKFNKKNNSVNVKCSGKMNTEPVYEYVQKMRASFLLLGPLLAKYKKAKISLPGGCAIGQRPVDLHLKGLTALGANIKMENGFIIGSATELVGTNIYLDFPSVGATENIIMAATLATGQTLIENCAIEPEIVDLVNFLNFLGADIRGAGTDTIRINGVKQLKGCEHTIIPDRIEAGTFMIAAAITKSKITIENVVIEHLRPVTAKLRDIGIIVTENMQTSSIDVDGENAVLSTTDIKTMPYPGYPTDLQAQIMALLSIVKGTSIINENIFENRFMHVSELNRMSANIKIEGSTAIIDGVLNLNGAKVSATDLRAGASLILAGLVASGTTEITNIHYIDRGYYKIDEKLASLGANIRRSSF